MANRILYALRADDLKASNVILTVRLALIHRLNVLQLGDKIEQHADLITIAGEEPPCAPVDSVPVFECGSMSFPSRYFRIITPENRDKLFGHVPQWAQSAPTSVALNPHANLDRREKGRGQLCFDLACMDLHGRLGGYTRPPQKRPHYSSGHKARKNRENLLPL